MEIRIGGYLAASFLLENEPATWDALVILDSGVTATNLMRLQARRHCILRFDDIQQATEDRVLVTSEQIKQGLDFANGSQKLLVSCRAGQSRSAAMAYLIACQANGVDAALRLIDPTRHVPSPRIVKLAASLHTHDAANRAT